ncbi:MAG: hypothetical protein NVSMB1_17770 [Polyangiales bacterium]
MSLRVRTVRVGMIRGSLGVVLSALIALSASPSLFGCKKSDPPPLPSIEEKATKSKNSANDDPEQDPPKKKRRSDDDPASIPPPSSDTVAPTPPPGPAAKKPGSPAPAHPKATVDGGPPNPWAFPSITFPSAIPSFTFPTIPTFPAPPPPADAS